MGFGRRLIMKNRLLALLLVAVFAFSVCPAYAQGTADSADNDTVRFLNALGIMGIDEQTGYFWDETPVKRSEMAEILCNMLGLKVSEDASPVFEDVQGEARGYIETIVRNGYMAGYGNGRFGPEDYITNEQLVKIFVCVIGAGKYAEYNGGYPEGYIYMAKRVGLLKGSNVSMSAQARRIDVANLVYATMHADIMTLQSIDSDGEEIYTKTEGMTFLTEELDIYRYTGRVEAVDSTSINRGDAGAGEDIVVVSDISYRDPDGLLDNCLGYGVVIYVKKADAEDMGDIVYVEEDQDNNVILINYPETDIISSESEKVTYWNGDKKQEISVNYIRDMVYNGKAITPDMNRLNGIESGAVKLVDYDGDRKYDFIDITEYEAAVLKSVKEETETVYLKHGKEPLILENNIYKIFRDGVGATIADLKEDDVLLIAVSENKTGEKAIRIEACSATKAGYIESVSEREGKKYFKIDGNEYTVNPYYYDLLAKVLTEEASAGVTAEIHFDSRGKIVFAEANVGGMDVGYLVDYSINAESFTKNLMVKIYTQEKKIEVFKVENSFKVNDETVKVDNILSYNNIMEQLGTHQLVQYRADNGVLKSINFGGAATAFDRNRFSLDVNDTLSATASGVFEQKYYISKNTKIFLIPSELYINEEKYYSIGTGPYFSSTETRPLKFYDVSEVGEVKYAVANWSPQWTGIGNASAMLLVEEVHDELDANGEEIKVITGYNEQGTKVSLKCSDFDNIVKNRKNRAEDGTVSIVSDPSLMIEPGDVLQYRNDYGGYVHGIIVHHKVSENKFYIPEKIEIKDSTGIADLTYGRVLETNGECLVIKCEGAVGAETEPYEWDKVVRSGSKAIYRVNRDKKFVDVIEFGEIVSNDEIVVCVNSSNNIRMLVIYE